MAVCPYCNQEMRDRVSCTDIAYDFDDGESLGAEPYEDGGNCHDCGTPSGGLHHPGCDMERCPRCGGQAIACDC